MKKFFNQIQIIPKVIFGKRLISLLLVLSAFSAINTPTVSAADYLLGVRGGYFMWDPWMKDLVPLFENMDTGSGALYGPVASVILTDNLSFSFSGLFGKQKGSGLTEDIQEGTEMQTLQYDFDTFRMDLDAALSYRLMENFKVFAGYKFWYLESDYKSIDYRYTGTTLDGVYQESITITQPFHGPALGLGVSFPLGDRGYFFAANLSGLYMMGKMDMDFDPMIRYLSSDGWAKTTESQPDQSIKMQMYGFNIEPTVGLNPGEGLPIITLGVRFQVNRLKLIDSAPSGSGMSDGWMTDMIYGVFVGVLYHI